MRAAALALALAACTAPAPAPADPMAAFAPLMGCWRGTFANQPDIHDDRCFEPLNAHVVDVHYVRPTTYWGETTFHYDEAQNEIVFAYAAVDGGRSNGVVRVEGDRLIVDPHTHRWPSGREQRLRAEWRIIDEDNFLIVSERLEEGAWVPMGRIAYARVEAE